MLHFYLKTVHTLCVKKPGPLRASFGPGGTTLTGPPPTAGYRAPKSNIQGRREGVRGISYVIWAA